MTRCLLLLGGNVGDRRAHLQQGFKELAHLPRTRLLRRSRVYETAPVGPSRRPFLNAAAEITTELSPMGLLVELKRLEGLAGRAPGKPWGAPRPLDVDLISFGARRMRGPWLTLPHPRAPERPFAAAPLADISPKWRNILKDLNPQPGTVRIDSRG